MSTGVKNKHDVKVMQALKDSVEHWNVDIINRFKNGRYVVGVNRGDSLLWDDMTEVMDGYKDCPLCLYTISINTTWGATCDACPYKQFYRHSCDSVQSAWHRWRAHLTISDAVVVRDSIQSIIDHINESYDYYKRGYDVQVIAPVEGVTEW